MKKILLALVLVSVSSKADTFSAADAAFVPPTYFMVNEPTIVCTDCSSYESLPVLSDFPDSDQPRISDLLSANPIDSFRLDTEILNNLTWGEIIRVGKAVWKVIQDNKPVARFETGDVSALPANVKNWNELTNWQVPVSRTYAMTYKNRLGIEVVKFSYRILYTAGGQYADHGHYLSRVTVLADKLEVLWGFKFEAEASVPSVVNLGSKENPLAGAEILLKWHMNAVVPIQDMQRSSSYFVSGTGAFRDLNAAN